jgi:very-short-patch-repair endonuclease
MEQLKFAKYLRHRMTESETMLWRHLRAHRLNGEKFRRVVACARVQGAAVLEQRNHE